MAPPEHTITEIEVLKRPRGYRAVYVDGDVALRAHRDVVAAVGLNRGQRLDSRQLDQALVAAQEEDALRQARALLAGRDRTESELRRGLSRRGFPQPTIATVLDRLRNQGLIDDHRYAREYVRTQSARRGLGPAALRARLTQLGMASALVEQALAEELPEEAQATIAEGVARKRLRRLRRSESEDARARLYAFIVRRGFDHGVAARTLESVLGEDDE